MRLFSLDEDLLLINNRYDVFFLHSELPARTYTDNGTKFSCTPGKVFRLKGAPILPSLDITVTMHFI